MEKHYLNARSCLWALVTLHLVMLAAMVTRTVPHPPLTIPLFALGPFFGAVLGIAAFSISQLKAGSSLGLVSALLVAALSLISFGPQKLIAPEIGQVWPPVPTGLAAAFALPVITYLGLRECHTWNTVIRHRNAC